MTEAQAFSALVLLRLDGWFGIMRKGIISLEGHFNAQDLRRIASIMDATQPSPESLLEPFCMLPGLENP